MKKLFIPLIFLFGFFLFPINTYAQDVSGTTSFYIQRSNSGSGSVWYPYAHINGGYDSGLNSCIGKGFWQGCDIPPIDNNLKQFYAITLQDLQLTYNFQANHVYTITANYWVGSYVYPDSSPLHFPISHNNQSYASQGTFTINSFEQYDDGYSNHKAYRLVGTFVPRANYNSVILGIGNNDNDKVIFVGTSSTNSDNYVLQAGASVDESGSSTTNIAPIVEQQQQTNQKLDDINNNQQQTNNKIDETNDKLDSLADDLVDDTAPSSNDISDFQNNLPALSFGPISGALQIPIQYLNYWHTQFESHSCSPINLGSLLGTNLTLPCFNPVDDYLNANTTMGGLNSFIGIVCALFIYYNTALLIVHAWDTWTSFADDFSGLYRPPSGDSYTPKHAKGGGN